MGLRRRWPSKGTTMPKRTPTLRVTPIPDSGKWRVKWDGAERSSAVTTTQRVADARAREIARNAGGAEVVTHGEDGKIRSKDTIARGDPNPPKDREH